MAEWDLFSITIKIHQQIVETPKIPRLNLTWQEMNLAADSVHLPALRRNGADENRIEFL